MILCSFDGGSSFYILVYDAKGLHGGEKENNNKFSSWVTKAQQLKKELSKSQTNNNNDNDIPSSKLSPQNELQQSQMVLG